MNYYHLNIKHQLDTIKTKAKSLRGAKLKARKLIQFNANTHVTITNENSVELSTFKNNAWHNHF